MNQDKEVLRAIISLGNIQYSCFVELLDMLTMMLTQKRLLWKRFLLFMNSDSKTQNRNFCEIFDKFFIDNVITFSMNLLILVFYVILFYCIM